MKKGIPFYHSFQTVLPLVCVLMVLVQVQALGIEVAGNQSGIWSLNQSPYIVINDVIVPVGQSLTIEPGTVIRFAGFYQFKILGTLIARGEPYRRIIFTSDKDLEFGGPASQVGSLRPPSPNDWSVIEFFEGGSQSSSEMSNCIIRYSVGVIRCNNVNPQLKNIMINHCNTNQLNINNTTVSIVQGRDLDIPTSIATSQALPSPVTPSIPPSLDSILEAEEFTFGEITVITAARREQAKSDAPAVMTVITAEEIQQRGYRTILEALRDVPGFDINDNGNWVDTGIRGVNERVTYGKHIQYLLDGHDMGFKQFTRNLVSPSWVAMSNIKRIEIIRGPGSALWGANAFLGVVNIITKDSEDVDKFELVSQAGSFNTTSFAYHGGKKLGTDGTLYTSLALYRDNTSEGRKIFEWSKVASQDIYVSNDKEINYTLQVKANYKDFYLKGHFDRYDPYAPISTFSVGGPQTRFITDRKYATLSWEPVIKEVKTCFDVTYQNYKFGSGAQYEDNPFNGDLVDLPPTGTNPHFIRPMKAVDDFIKLSARGEYTFSENFWGIGGIEYEHLNSIRWYYPDVFKLDELDEPKFNVQSVAIYAEGQYQIHPGLNSTIGVRHDHHSIYGSVTNPRLGLVWHLPLGFYTKALYGKAFKAPSLHELYYFRKNAYYGNPQLLPEKIHTGEILLGYELANKVFINVNYHYSYATDIINYKSRSRLTPLVSAEDFPQTQWPTPDSTKSYNQQENNTNYIISGLELESKVVIAKNFTVFFNGALNLAKDKDTDERLYYTAQKFASFGATYFALDQVNITLLGRYVGAKLLPEMVFKEPGNPNNPTVDETFKAASYLVTDLVFHVPTLFNNKVYLTFKINNLFNTEYYDAGREVLYAQMPRSFFGTLGIRY